MFEYDPDDVTWPDGDYTAEILTAADTMSKKTGNPMITFCWQAFWGNKTTTIFDYIGAWNLGRLKRLCVAASVDFAGGKVDPGAFVGKRFNVALKTREDKNVISTFAAFDDTEPPSFPVGAADDPDIPF